MPHSKNRSEAVIRLGLRNCPTCFDSTTGRATPGSFLEATPWSIVQSQGHFGRPEAPYPPQLFLESCVTALAPSLYALPLDLDRGPLRQDRESRPSASINATR